jgi:DNA primase large subunit
VDNFSISVFGSNRVGFTINFNRIDGDRPLTFKFESNSFNGVINIMIGSFTAGNTITNSSDASDDAKYQLKLDDENLGYIRQYIHDKVTPKVKPAGSVQDFFSEIIAAEARVAEARAAEARAAEDDAAAESTP